MLKNLMKGFEIFLKYNPDIYLEADHDIIFGPWEDEFPFTDIEKEILKENGWSIHKEQGTWAAFV